MRGVAFLLLVGLAGCQCGPVATEPGPFRFEVPDFEPTLRGAVTQRTVTFFNDGDTPLRLVGLEVTPHTAFSLVGDSALDVPAGGTATVDVKFAPTSFGAHVATLRFRLAADGQPLAAPLSAECIGPVLSVEPTSIDLGTLELYPGQTVEASAMLTLRNPGQGADLHASFAVPGGAGGELCVGDCAGGEVRVPADGLAQAPIHFTATTPGARHFDVRVTSDDPDHPEATVVVTADVVERTSCQFAFTPAALDFGVVTPPEPRTRVVRFENTGTSNCEVSSVDLGPEWPPRGLPAFRLELSVAPRTLAPGEGLDLAVSASDAVRVPFMPSTVDGALLVHVNRADGPASLPLHVLFDRPCVVVAPDALDFGTQAMGCTASPRTLTVYNFCAGPVTVTGASTLAPFSVSTSLPQVIAPNASLPLSIAWTPAASGTFSAQVAVQWDEGTRLGSAEVPVTGRLVTNDGRDVFAPGRAQVDVLLVLDDSNSMTQVPVDAVISRLRALLPALDAQPLDYRVAAMTGGRLLGVLRRASDGSRWLTRTTPMRAARYDELIAWTDMEQDEGQEAPVFRGLTPPLSLNPLFNGGFLRDTARLSVVGVTDQGDTIDLLAQILALKPPGFLRWDAFAPMANSPCGFDPFSPNSHAVYAAATGGEYTDLCASSWAPAFADLASWAATRTIFPLSGVVAPQGMPTVEVSGVTVPAITVMGAPVWTFDAASNQVRFELSWAPSYNDTVVVTYPAACAP